MRVVLDVNLLVSAKLTPQGEAQAVLDRAESNYTLLLSDFILQQVARVLRYPRIHTKYPHITAEVISTHQDELRETGQMVVEKASPAVCSDPEDNRILAAAVDGRADYLVTRNTSHFPPSYEQVKVLSPDDFLKLVRQQEGQGE